MVVLFSSWIPGIRVFFLFFLCFFSVFRCKSWFFTRWSCFLAGFLEFVFFFSFFCVFFLFSDVKVDLLHGGPVFFLDSWNSCFFSLFFLCFFSVFRCKSWFFTRWSCFLAGFLEFVFFFSFFCVFFLFSDVKVDLLHGGPVFFLDSWNSCFFSLFFLCFFPVFRCKSWFFTRWSCFLPGFLEFVFFSLFLCFFSVSFTFIFCFF